MAALKFTVQPDRNYACRDCPARCCRVPWSIRFTEAEAQRYLGEAWIRERVGAPGLKVLATGVLPMREHQRRLQCVFLDDDELCGLQKQFGHTYLPRPCQSFPFGFVARGNDQVLVQLSQLCPSIRDNYGDPVKPQLKAKLEQAGEAKRVATAMSTRNKIILPRAQYLLIAQAWIEQLGEDVAPTELLARLADQLLAFEQALPTDQERVKDAVCKAALEQARAAAAPEPLVRPAKASFHARALHSFLLGNLSYPSTLRQPHRVGPGPAFLALRSARNKLAWMRGKGTVDLLFTPGPIALREVGGVAPFLDGPLGAIVRGYLRTVLERERVFTAPRYLADVLVELCFATVLISRFARCLALASQRTTVIEADVREGIGVAELVLLGHVMLGEEGKTLRNLRALMLADRDKLRLLLASEI